MEHPILFSTPMVQAILEGRKTQTRRVIKNFSVYEKRNGVFDYSLQGGKTSQAGFNSNLEDMNDRFFGIVDYCPYGKVGDVLWLRETHLFYSDENGNDAILYKADEHAEEFSKGLFETQPKWKPSIHMPYAACRLFLEITNIKVERLHSISEKDAKAEGVEQVEWNPRPFETELLWKHYVDERMLSATASVSFQTLWQKINGKESWYANPWVWVVEFKRIDKPKNK